MGELLRRRLGAVIVVAVLVLFVSASTLAGFAVDWWWFEAVGFREVFTTVLSTRLAVAAAGAVVLGGLVAINLQVARRMRPLFVPSSPQQAQVERYRELADPYLPWLIAGIAVLFGLSSGAALSSEWDTVLLYLNGAEFGIEDPQFGRDIGFFVFELPLLKLVQEWLLTSLVLVTLLTVGAHYLLGGIRPENPGDKVMPNVKAHLSALFALVLAAWAWGYWLDRFLLNFSPRGTVTGASYTDVNAELPALNLLLVVALVSIVLVAINVRQRGFLLPGAAVGLLLLGSIFLQGVYPAAIQRLQVDPQELARERPFIARNLEATRTAYGLADVELRPFEIENDLDQDQVEQNDVTLTNVRLWDPAILQTTYAELQALRPYYEFADVDVDRYVVDGEIRQVMLSARELDQADLPAQAQTWQNRVLTYTHGYGMVASLVNTATAQKQPVFLAEDIPPNGDEELVPEDQPGIYYGESLPPFNIVNTDAQELDFEEPATQQQVYTEYAGEGGVQLSSLLRRAAFAVNEADTNTVLSGLIRDDSRILINRDIADRVAEVAPFLTLDRDPYPVVTDGGVKWIQDAYTTSAFYPYSERRFLTDTPGAPVVNYVRNSVKAVVDAYDGTIELFVVEPDDPVIQAWQGAFPGIFTSLDELPEGLEEHFRWPEDLFTLQADVYTTYHIPEADAFYTKADEWDIPPDAAALQNAGGGTTAPPLEPYYLLMRLPGEQDEEFVLIQPYLANERPNMVAWLAARMDPGSYGELFAVAFPSDSQVLGTAQVQTRIEQDDDIAEYITLRSQEGSTVRRGNMIVLPIEESIVYVEPLFLEGGSAEIPELARVVLVMGDQVVFEETLAQAVATLVGAPPPTDVEEEDPLAGEDDAPAQPDDGSEPLPPADIDQEALVEALEAFGRAQAALERGDLGEYQRLVEEARRLVAEASESAGVDADAVEPEPSPSPEASPDAADEEATQTSAP